MPQLAELKLDSDVENSRFVGEVKITTFWVWCLICCSLYISLERILNVKDGAGDH